MMGYSHNGSGSSNERSSNGHRFDTSQDRGYNARDRDSSSRGYGNSQEQGLNSREFESRDQRSNSQGYGASRDQGFNSRGYGEASPAYKGDNQGNSGDSWGRGSQSYGGGAYNQSSEPNKYGVGSGEYGSTPAEYDFFFEDKLFVTCTQKFRPDDICQFFKSFGAVSSAETDQEGEVVSTARILFKTKEDAERVFAIWHSKFSLLFHCRMFFSRTSNPQLRESGPATTKVVVTGFASGVDELEVYHLFRSIGPLYDCSLTYSGQPADPPCAILQFIKDELNEQAISKFNGFQFQGEKLKVELFDKTKHFDSNSRSRAPLKANESYRVEVTGFSSDCDQAELLKYFKTVGEIIDVEFDGPNSRCMINYDTAIGAFGAMQRFNNYRVGSRNLTVKSTGRPAPKPFASIPLIEKPQQASSVVPSSRDVKHSRWSQKADESSNRPRTSNYSGSNSGSQYGGEKPADQSSTFDFTSLSHSNPQNQSSRTTEAPQSTSWNAPATELGADNWNAPAAAPKANNSWDAPVAEPKANNNWRAPAAEPKLSGWEAPVVDPKPNNWSAPMAESQTKNSWDGPVAGPKSPSWNGPLNCDQKPRCQEIPKTDSEHHSVSPSRSSTPEHMTLTQFLESNLSPPLVGLLKSLSPGSEHTIEQIIKTLFDKSPESMVALACSIQDVAVQVKEIEAKLQEKHQFSLSEEAYQRIKKGTEGDKMMCNYEFLPLHPQKEKLLQQIMMAPKEQSYPAMISLLSKRLAHLGFSDTMPKAQAIAQTSSLRLMMVSYCYDNVLQDLHDELVASQNRS
ncbi:hypothetical protein DSO57_1012265 [Entomophthora muscae]|uniref:Uncharacterized protein n=1 Tax=Entomophthora muscae TaxID=34485 RepID=A0ACC2RX57_9FUNG|nr:hypothetical protein DSO57_1012265 [Entomophthora muscae]